MKEAAANIKEPARPSFFTVLRGHLLLSWLAER